MAISFALICALLNSTTTILQRAGTTSAPADLALKPSLFMHLVRKPIWLAGMAAMIGAFVFQALALNFGPVSQVQPILAMEMVFLLIVIALIYRVRFSARDWISSSAIACGLGLFLWGVSPTQSNKLPAVTNISIAIIAGVILIAGISFLAFRLDIAPAIKSALYGGAGAICFGYSALSIKVFTVIWHKNAAQFYRSWSPYALIVFGLAGLYLAQNSFYSGPISASQSALTIVDPIVSILLGVFVLNESIGPLTPKVLVGLVSLGGVAYGVVQLNSSRSMIQYYSHQVRHE